MAKAFDRVKNADNRADMFIKTEYWGNGIEDQFEIWSKDGGPHNLEALIDGALPEGVAVSFKFINDSCCCTLAHQANKDAGLPYLLTGWSTGCLDAYLVANFKLAVMLKGVWEAAPAPKVTHRR